MRLYRQAETFALYAAGPPIVFTPEEEQLRERLKKRLQEKVERGEIQPLDAKSPQSVTDANEALWELR